MMVKIWRGLWYEARMLAGQKCLTLFLWIMPDNAVSTGMLLAMQKEATMWLEGLDLKRRLRW